MAFSAPARVDDHVSIKLRALNMKNTKNAKATTRQLEMENQRMEERLQELRLAMNREKEDREKRGTGSGFWESGKEGRVITYNKEAKDNKSASNRQNREKNSASRRNRVKVLKDEPIVVPERNTQPGTLGNIAKRSAYGTRNVKGPRCGQCEHKGANVSCQECGEDYCAACFASFHLKGALRKHRSVPIGSGGTRTPRPTIPTENPPDASDETLGEIKIIARPISSRTDDSSSDSSGPAPAHRPPLQQRSKVQVQVSSNCEQVASLMDGAYDEEENAAAFQLALQEWRKGKTGASQNTRNVMDVSESIPSGNASSTGTDHGTCTAPERHAPVEIQFKQSLTYAEKLLLKRSRQEQQPDDKEFMENGLDHEAEVDLGAMLAMSRGVTPAPQNEDYFRAESRVSVIDLDEFQEPRQSLRGLDQSSSYFVQEMPEGLDYYRRAAPPESRAAFSSPTPKPPAGKPRTPNSAKRRGVRSPISKDTAASDTDTTPILDLKALNDYKQQSRRELQQRNQENTLVSSFDTACSSELPPSKSRAELEKYYDRKKKKVAKSEVKLPDEVPGARPKSKTGFQPRIKSRTSNRPGSRATSRAASRTGSRMSVSGEGLLTKGPSDGLRALAERTNGLPPIAPEAMLGLGDFFMAGVRTAPEDDVSPPTPRPQSRAKSARPNTGRQSRQEEKWKVSYKTYQMAPRSWKPGNSVGESLSDQQLDLQLEQGAKDFVQMFGTQEPPPEALVAVREASLSFSLSGAVDTGVDESYQQKEPLERLSSARSKSATKKSKEKPKIAENINGSASNGQSSRVSSRNEEKNEKKKSTRETPLRAERAKSSRETPLGAERAKSSMETPLSAEREKSSRETPLRAERAKSSRETPLRAEREKSSRETPRMDSARSKSSHETPRLDSARSKPRKSSREKTSDVSMVDGTPRGASAMSDATPVPEVAPRLFSRQRSRPGTPRASSLSESLGNGRKTPRVSSGRMKTPALPEEPAEGAEAERPESRVIVVDGDDMSKYDDELLAIQQDEDDAAALNQLEWELASQEGRVTADGQISRMSQFNEIAEEDMELGIGSDDGRSSGLSTPGPTLDWDSPTQDKLRESVLMDDFESMEQEMAAADDEDKDGDDCDDLADVRGLR